MISKILISIIYKHLNRWVGYISQNKYIIRWRKGVFWIFLLELLKETGELCEVRQGMVCLNEGGGIWWGRMRWRGGGENGDIWTPSMNGIMTNGSNHKWHKLVRKDILGWAEPPPLDNRYQTVHLRCLHIYFFKFLKTVLLSITTPPHFCQNISILESQSFLIQLSSPPGSLFHL